MKNLNWKAVFILKRLWYKYKIFVREAMLGEASAKVGNSISWKENLFINCIIYAIPFSFLALVPSIIITFQRGYLLIPFYDLFALVSIILVALNRHLTVSLRKAYVVLMLYCLSVILIASLGAFGIGSIYLLAVGVFIALLFSTRVVYFSIAINFIIYTCFALIIHFKLFHSPLISHYTLGLWGAYASNFLFLDIVVILQIRQVISGLEYTIVHEQRLLKQLKIEIAEKVQRNELLRESEVHYKSLFLLNPSPMWIFDINDLRFLQVNDAAIMKYGYSEEEFLAMTIKDIRKKENVATLLDILDHTLVADYTTENVVQHCGKDGQLFYVEVRCSTIPFRGKQARLVIARNINAHIEYTQAIEKQNKKLQEIAFMQSHVVRAPLARIMALSSMLMQDKTKTPDGQVLNYLDISVKELDDVIRAIINHTDTLYL